MVANPVLRKLGMTSPPRRRLAEDLVPHRAAGLPATPTLGALVRARAASPVANGNALVAAIADLGAQNTDEPSSGRLLLADGELRVVDIARLRLNGARLAFLSACETAVGGSRLPDEAIHLTAALQLAGFPHVIGTLWPVGDFHVVAIAEQVYRALAADGSAVAHALHHAVRALRATARPTNGVGIPHPCMPVNSRSGGGWTRWCC